MKARKIVLHCCEWVDRLVDMLWNAAAACLCFILVALAVQIFRRTVLNSPIFGIEEAVTAAVGSWRCSSDKAKRPRSGGILSPFCSPIPEKACHRSVVHLRPGVQRADDRGWNQALCCAV